MLLIGNNIELLSSFALNLSGIDTIIFTKEPPAVIGEKLTLLKDNIPVVVLDVDQGQQDISGSLLELKRRFPHSRILALYHASNQKLTDQLLQMGFDHVLTLDDDLNGKIQEYLPK